MKRIFCVLTALVLLAGCQNSPTFPETPQTQSVGRPWASDLILTFANEPSNETRELFKAARVHLESANGGHGQRTFVLLSYSRHNDAQNAALEAALREGAILTPP